MGKGFIQETFKQKKYAVIGICAALLLESLFLYFTQLDLMIGNYGITHAYSFLFLDAFNAVLFGIYIPLFIYTTKKTKRICTTSSTTGVIGTTSSALVSGCTACSITLASYLGLASILSALPLYGFELKIVGAILLVFSIRKLSKNNPDYSKNGSR